MRAATADLSPPELKILTDVEDYGMHVLHVPEDDKKPGFSFSVGLWHTFEQPEVIVFGLPPEIAHELLNALAEDAEDGRRFLADSRHEGLLQHYPVRFFAVPKARYGEFFGCACWAYEGDEFEAVQLVWPDKQGRWPWDRGVREDFRAGQPVLCKQEPTA